MSLPHFQSPIGYFSVRCRSACHSICMPVYNYVEMYIGHFGFLLLKSNYARLFSFQFCCMKITYDFLSHFVSLALFPCASLYLTSCLCLSRTHFLCVIFPLYTFFLPSIHITIIRLVTSVSNSKLSCLRAAQAVVCVLHFNPVRWFGMWRKREFFPSSLQSYL